LSGGWTHYFYWGIVISCYCYCNELLVGFYYVLLGLTNFLLYVWTMLYLSDFPKSNEKWQVFCLFLSKKRSSIDVTHMTQLITVIWHDASFLYNAKLQALYMISLSRMIFCLMIIRLEIWLSYCVNLL
jgi:hypothetical protein